MTETKFWNKAIVQITYVGFLAFCCPGMFNAMNGLGKAGGNSADISNAANASLYACFAVFGYFGGAFFNMLGNRVLMLVGGSCYAIYAGGIYLGSNIEHGTWVASLSGCILGFGAGWFWTSQGAMMMAYATPEKKGTYIGIFWILFTLGATFGGILSMAINWNSESEASASPASYFVFVGIMVLGAIGSVFLAPAHKVVREDGEPVVFQKAQSAKEEIKGALMVATNRYMLLLSMLFLCSNFGYPYRFNAVNGAIFNVRTRGFNSAMYWLSQMLGAYLIGVLLDWNTFSLKKRGMLGFLAVAILMNLAYILGCILQYSWDGALWDKHWINGAWVGPFVGREVDFIHHSGRAAFPIICFMLYGIADGILQTYAYWVMAALSGPDASLAARFAGFYKGIQSAGAAISWGLDLGVSYEPQFWICWSMFIVCLPCVYLAVRDLEAVEERSGEALSKNDSNMKKSASIANTQGDDVFNAAE